MVQRAIIPVSSAISSGWPKNLRIGDANKYIGRSKMQNKKRTIQDRCIYTPNMSYFLAPNACPHSVSNALAIPSCIYLLK